MKNIRSAAFYPAIIVLVIAMISIMFSGCVREKKSFDIIYTANLQGNILELPINRYRTSGEPLEFYNILRVMNRALKMKQQSEKEKIPVVVIDGGNSLFGIDDFSGSQKGKPALDLMKLASCAAMAPGEAEFLFGLQNIDNPGDKFAFFAGNYKQTSSPAKKNDDSAGKESGPISSVKYFQFNAGKSTAVFFSYFEPFESVMLPGVQEKYQYADFNPSIDDLNKAISEQKADVKILIARVNDVEKLASELKGVDVIICGRYSDALEQGKVSKINNIQVIPYINSRYRGPARIRLSHSGFGGWKVDFSTETPDPMGKASFILKPPGVWDPSLDKFTRTYGENYIKVHSSFLGYGDDRLTHTTGRPQETPTAFVIADMLRNYSGSDLALINLFSLRKSLGGIIRGEWVDWVAPFGNSLVTMDLTGAEVEEIMKLNLRRDTKFMVISGASVQYGENNRNLALMVYGKPIDKKKMYRVATNDYLARSDKMEYKIFQLGRKKNFTDIPINGIFLETLINRRFLGIPPERVGHKSQEEIGKIADDKAAGLEAYKWGYFNLAIQKLEKYLEGNPGDTEALNTLAEIYIYCDLPGRAKETYSRNASKNSPAGLNLGSAFSVISSYDLLNLEEIASLFIRGGSERPGSKEGADKTPSLKTADLFIGSALYRTGHIKEASKIWFSQSEQFPNDIRYRRLTEAAAGPSAEIARELPPLWAKFKGDPQNTGRTPFEGPASKRVRVKWKFKTFHSVKSSPAIGHDGTIYIGGGDGIFYAISPEGKKLWSYDLSGFILSSPAIDKHGTIYVGRDAPGTRNRRQTFREGQDNEPTGAGYLCAFSPDGTLKWQVKTGAWVASSPLITREGNIVVGCNDKNVYCFTPNGEIKWKYRTDGKIFSSPAMGKNGHIYIGSEDFVFYAIDSNGEQKWKYKAENKFFSSPAVSDDGTVYVGNDDANLYAFNPDGSLKWKKKFPAAVTSTVSFDRNGDLLIGCEDGKLYRMTPEHKLIWALQRENEFFSSPIIDPRGNIYIGSEDNYLYCVSPKGKLIWQFETGDYVESTAVIGPGKVVYLGAEDHYIYALEEDKGE